MKLDRGDVQGRVGGIGIGTGGGGGGVGHVPPKFGKKYFSGKFYYVKLTVYLYHVEVTFSVHHEPDLNKTCAGIV